MITYHGGEGTQQEGDGREETTVHVPSGTPGHQDENDDTEDPNEPTTDDVLGLEEGLGAFVDDTVDLLETGRLLLVGASRERLGLATARRRDDGDTRDHSELDEGP